MSEVKVWDETDIAVLRVDLAGDVRDLSLLHSGDAWKVEQLLSLAASHEALRAERDALRDAARELLSSWLRKAAALHEWQTSHDDPMVGYRLAVAGYRRVIHNAKAQAQHLGIEWSDDMIPDWMQQILAEGPDTRPDPAQAEEWTEVRPTVLTDYQLAELSWFERCALSIFPVKIATPEEPRIRDLARADTRGGAVSDPVEVVAEAIQGYPLRHPQCPLDLVDARRALESLRADGWRIVKLGTYSGVEPPYVTDEWTPEPTPEGEG